jgi:hypothetical protein
MQIWPNRFARSPASHAHPGTRGRDPSSGLACSPSSRQPGGLVVTPTPLRQIGGYTASPLEAHGDASGKLPNRKASLPVHRSILAIDIEGSTQRTNPIKEVLREQVYGLAVEALGMAGIERRHYEPFTDRGDGLLVLLRPADDFPKPLLLSRLIPALGSLLISHNSGVSPADQPRILRLRVVVHAGEVHRDGKGFFGEDLDLAFRLLDAPRFKAYLRNHTAPLAVVASDYLYQSIIRHGYDGINGEEFLPLVTVTVGSRRTKGWVHLPCAEGLPVAVSAQVRVQAS